MGHLRILNYRFLLYNYDANNYLHGYARFNNMEAIKYKDNRMERLTISDKLFYAVGGGFASNLSFYAMLVFFITYASDVYGVSPATVGAITLAARGIDAFIDPIMGAIGDRTRTRFGKYRFWIITSAPVLGFTTWLVLHHLIYPLPEGWFISLAFICSIRSCPRCLIFRITH